MAKNNLFRIAMVFCIVMATWLVAGCNNGPKLPPLANVSGTVTLDGKPVTIGAVVFVPDPTKGTDGPVGIGTIDENGRFQIRTADQPGAIIGHHKVRVGDPLGRAPAIPLRYTNPDKSGLTVEVKEGQDNVCEFKLSSKR